jgi:hypothetical protein
MQVRRDEDLTERILAILGGFVPRSTALDRDKLIGRDLGIRGWDSIDLLERLEREFELDLRPFVDTKTAYLKPRLVDRLLGREHGPANADATVGQLVDYIIEHSPATP